MRSSSKKQKLLKKKIEKKMIESVKKIISGGKLNEEEKDFLAKDSRPNEVKFPNFKTMIEVFTELGLSKDLIDDIIKHEMAHFDVAQMEGLNPQILIKFFRLKNGTIKFLPTIKVGFKEEKHKVSESLKKTAKAPFVPSSSDVEKIN